MFYLIPIGLVTVAGVLGLFLMIRLRYEPAIPATTTGARPMTAEEYIQQRRQFTRVAVTVHAEMRVADGRRVRGETRDLSLMGAYVLADSTMAPLTECDMFLLVEAKQQVMPVRLRLRGRVVRANDDGFAVEFTGMTRECYDNLRIVLAHKADEQQIENEAKHHPLRDTLDTTVVPDDPPPADFAGNPTA